MHDSFPLLSIVIATYNCAEELEKTLRSFETSSLQGGYEVIIQDGASHDKTLSTAARHTSLPILMESCPDKGIYDAWNKALQRISGQWILFIGAGDTFCTPHALHDAMQALSQLPNSCKYYSVPVQSVFPPDETLESLCAAISPQTALLHGMCLPHQGLFHHCSLFVRNKFDTTYRIAGDYDFVCRTLTKNNIKRGELPCVRMVFGGLSSDMRHMVTREIEFLKISRKTFPSSISWKILLRLLLWQMVWLITKVLGEDCARKLADLPRRLQKKLPLWTRRIPSVYCLPLLTPPRFALCIATVGRIDELDRLLTSLEQQSYTNFHVYLADQNAPGMLDAMLEQHASLPMTRIMIPSRGVSHARNALLPLAAELDIIAFPDDDCWYAPNTLEQVAAFFRRHNNVGALIGMRLSGPSNNTEPQYSEKSVSWMGFFKNGETYLQFFRLEAVQNINFDPHLGPGTGLPYGCGEDTDYLLEVQKQADVWRCHGVWVFHPSPDTQLPPNAKIASYAAGRMFLLRKHKSPFWFRCANVLYPLCMLPIDALRKGRGMASYRWCMFKERLRHF